MGLDLYALKKRPSFNKEELDRAILEKHRLDDAWDKLQEFVSAKITKLYKMDLEQFLETFSSIEQDKKNR